QRPAAGAPLWRLRLGAQPGGRVRGGDGTGEPRGARGVPYLARPRTRQRAGAEGGMGGSGGRGGVRKLRDPVTRIAAGHATPGPIFSRRNDTASARGISM